jgi:hypothetical protein
VIPGLKLLLFQVYIQDFISDPPRAAALYFFHDPIYQQSLPDIEQAIKQISVALQISNINES